MDDAPAWQSLPARADRFSTVTCWRSLGMKGNFSGTRRLSRDMVQPFSTTTRAMASIDGVFARNGLLRSSAITGLT
jgi:hypothetical protein